MDGSSGMGATLPGIQLRPTLPGGEIPTSVTTGDFNNDGIMDFVVANGQTSDLWIYLGNGDGTFQLPRIIPLTQGLTPVYVASGDLSGNGKLDLVVAESDTSTVGVLLGNGDGTFGYETSYSLPQPPSAIVLADFNRDGKIDIAASMITVNDSQGFPVIALLTGDGTGKFTGPAISYRPELLSGVAGLDAADVNGDGLPDLLLVDPAWQGPNTGAVIYLNNGDGTFTLGQSIVENGGFNDVQDGRLADVNEDGCPDAVIADESGQVWVALGDCSGHFATPTWFRTGDSNAAIHLADMNGDGHLDIVTSAFPGLTENYGALIGFTAGNTLSIAFGDGRGNFSVPRSYLGSGQSTSLAIADFNGDGHPDVVTANNDTDSVTVYQNDGAGAFGFPQGIYVDQPGDGVTNAPIGAPSFVDLNGDGKPDVVFLNAEEGEEHYLVSLLNDGTGRFAAPNFLDLHQTYTDAPIGDYRMASFRGGSSEDFVGVEAYFGSAPGYIVFAPGNRDGTFGASVVTQIAGASGPIAVGDFNGDGKLDFAAVGTVTSTLTAFLGNNDGTFRAASGMALPATNFLATRVYSGDFNHDGKLDVLAFEGGDLWEFDGNGDGTFQAGRQLLTDLPVMALGDVNGDGQPDVSVFQGVAFQGALSTNSTITTYLGKPDGTFSQSGSYTPYAGTALAAEPFAQSGDPLASSLIADYNNDGKPEEVDVQQLEPSIQKYAQLLMGNGDGTFTPTYDVFPFYLYGWPAHGRDLDGDGYTDMLEFDSGSSTLHVIKGGPAPALQIALNDEVVSGNASCGFIFPDVVSSSDRTIMLASSVSGVQLPSSVTLPAQATSAQFCYMLSTNFDYHRVFDVTATMDGSSAIAYASDSYSEGFTLSISPNPPAAVYAGQTTEPMTVSLTAAPGYSSTVTLSCNVLYGSQDICLPGQSTLHLTAGQTVTTTVTLATTLSDGLSSPSFTLTASDSNITHRETVTVPLRTLSITAYSVELMTPSETTTFPVTVYGIPPFQFACTGLPSSVGCSIAGPPTTDGGASTYTGTLTSTSAAPGSYPFKIAVSSDGYSASSNQTLNVIDFDVQGTGGSGYAGQSGALVQLTATGLGPTQSTLTLACSLDFGGTCAGGSLPLTVPNPSATLSVDVPTSATAGQHTLTVTASYYLGSSNEVKTYTYPFTVTDFSGSLNNSVVTMSPSSNASVTVTLTGTAGFGATIDLGCTGATQVSCSFSNASPAVNASPTTVTLMLNSSASAALGPAPFYRRIPLLSFAVLLPFGLLLRRRSRTRLNALLLICAAVLLSQILACGGSGVNNTPPPPSSYSVTVNGTIAGTTIAHTLGTITVTVNH